MLFFTSEVQKQDGGNGEDRNFIFTPSLVDILEHKEYFVCSWLQERKVEIFCGIIQQKKYAFFINIIILCIYAIILVLL